jgi:hypothetical protein
MGGRYWEGKQFELEVAPGLTSSEYAAEPCRAAFTMLGIASDGPEVVECTRSIQTVLHHKLSNTLAEQDYHLPLGRVFAAMRPTDPFILAWSTPMDLLSMEDNADPDSKDEEFEVEFSVRNATTGAMTGLDELITDAEASLDVHPAQDCWLSLTPGSRCVKAPTRRAGGASLLMRRLAPISSARALCSADFAGPESPTAHADCVRTVDSRLESMVSQSAPKEDMLKGGGVFCDALAEYHLLSSPACRCSRAACSEPHPLLGKEVSAAELEGWLDEARRAASAEAEAQPMGAPSGSGCDARTPQVIYLIQGDDVSKLPCWCACCDAVHDVATQCATMQRVAAQPRTQHGRNIQAGDNAQAALLVRPAPAHTG